MDLVDAVLAACDTRGGAPALTRGSGRRETVAYEQLGQRIRSTADSLRDLGMTPGDRVLFSVRPGQDAVVLALAIVHAGGAVVFADPGAGESLFRARAALAAPRWVAAESLLHLASTPLLRPLARRRGLDLPAYGKLVADARHLYAGPWLPGVPRGAASIRGLRGARRGASRPDTRAASGDEALIVFTSGTTEAPRAVVHTRGSLGAGLGDIAATMRPGQRVLTDQLMVGIPALIAGAHWVLPPPGLDPGARPEAYVPLLADADVLFANPAAMDAILRSLGGAAPRLETIILGGAPVLRPLLARIRAAFPDAGIRAVYGMTEILPVAIADGAAKLERDDADGDWVGRIAGSVRARIDDDGELVLAGPGLASYLGDPPASEVRTGDLARLDGDSLTLLGRKKDMFIRGTQNVYPALYEPVIAGLPGVADAAMTGVPDAIGDDRIVVAVVPSDDPPAVADAGHPVARAVARTLPGLIDAGVLPDLVVAVPALPRSGRGDKLDRAALARLAGEAL